MFGPARGCLTTCAKLDAPGRDVGERKFAIGKSQTEVDDRAVEQEAVSLEDRATALVSEVRELRDGYEQLVARIDEAFAGDQAGAAPGVRASVSEGEERASEREGYLVNLAVSARAISSRDADCAQSAALPQPCTPRRPPTHAPVPGSRRRRPRRRRSRE